MRSLIFFLSLFFLPIDSGLNAQEAATLLVAAVYEEEVVGDLERAISIYKRIIIEYPDDRPVAAEALLNLGIANERLGHSMAREYYMQLLENYADQREFVIQARARLEILASATNNTVVPEAEIISTWSDGMLKTSKVFFPVCS